MELWRTSESSSSGVYLSPATTSDILDSDVASNWSDSEFEDDFDEDDCGFEEERDNSSHKTTSSSVSEVIDNLDCVERDLAKIQLVHFICGLASSLFRGKNGRRKKSEKDLKLSRFCSYSRFFRERDLKQVHFI